MRSSAKNMHIWIKLRIENLGEELAQTVLSAIKPDNLTAPAWLKIKENVEEGSLVLYIETSKSTPTRVGSLRNTVDEILSYTYALLKTIEVSTKVLKRGNQSV